MNPKRASLVRLMTGTAATVMALGAMTSTAMAATPAADQTPAGTAVAATGGATFAAFGDSFSSGEGTNAYLDGTDTTTNICHRSTLAYSGLLAKDLGITSYAFDACSGGVTADMFAPNNNGNKDATGAAESAQLCQTDPVDGVQACNTGREPALGPNTKIVTLTIGGNDAGLAKVVQDCVFGTVDGHDIGLPGRGCRYNAVTDKRVADRIAALGGGGSATSPYGSNVHSIASVLTAIHQVAPNAHVYIGGYPHVFQDTAGTDSVIGSLDVAGKPVDLKIAPDDATMMDDAADALDNVIRSAANKDSAFATYVDPVPAFAGHGLSTGSSWMNPIHATATIDLDAKTVDMTLDKGSLHPSVAGQAAYESAFLAAVKATEASTN